MVYSEVLDRSVFLIESYYDNKVEPLFSAMDEDCTFIGPLSGQWFSGVGKIRDLYNKEVGHDLRFSISDIRTNLVRTSKSSCEVILHLRSYTHYKSGIVTLQDVRAQLTWKDMGGGDNRIILIHLSYAFPKSELDVIYAVHGEDISSGKLSSHSLPRDTGVRIYFKCKDHTMLYLISSHILFIESDAGSSNSLVHSIDGDYETTHSLKRFYEEYSDVLLRAHSSYLVNPLHVRSLKRFLITMDEGSTIPVPEKKYTAFKKELNNWLLNWHRG